MFFLLGIHLAILTILKIVAFFVSTFNPLLAANTILVGFYLGIWQLFYAIPIILWLKRTQQWGRMKGVIIGAVVTFMTNVSFFFSFLS
ncbi:MAG: hypothetical protein N4J56_002354 [Chroococcidiopsis sp. SAG 2025]|nr:hypothetical protein [Chroococcidiopsis sp. SAG 2025]